MPTESSEVEKAVAIATLKNTVQHLEEKLESQKESFTKQLEFQQEEIDSLKKDRDSALRWGIVILGTSVMSMAAWIFKLIAGKIPSL